MAYMPDGPAAGGMGDWGNLAKGNQNPLAMLLARLGGTNQLQGNNPIQGIVERILAGQQRGGQNNDPWMGLGQPQNTGAPDPWMHMQQPGTPTIDGMGPGMGSGGSIDPGFNIQQGGGGINLPTDMIQRAIGNSKPHPRIPAVLGGHLMANQLAQFIGRARTSALPGNASSWLGR